MHNFTILVGLPGSGKTYYAQHCLKADIIIDDPKNFNRDVLNLIQSYHKNVVITDPWLCLESNRANLIKLLNSYYINPAFNWLYFENNELKCSINVKRRMLKGDARQTLNDIRYFAKYYTIPIDAKIVKVHWAPLAP